jgi:UDP-N-acetylglucosamine:LPS N-acetylglucosamine transferase
MTTSTICLFFSDTGGGHRSAADAIEAGIQSIIAEPAFKESSTQQLNVVKENIVEKSHFINRFFVELYNFMLRHNQAGMKYYYQIIHQFKPYSSTLGYLLIKSHVVKFLQKLKPDVVVSLHPMSNHYLARCLKESGLTSTRFIEIVTDPNENLWEGWACPEADLIIVPNLAAKNKLLAWGIPEYKLEVVGMPIHPNFLKPAACDREKFLTHLGLNPETFTLCINAGWAGGGNMTAIYKALQLTKKNIQVIFLCGNHSKLYKKISRLAAISKVPTRVLPFHDNMSELMNAVDLMVTKAGGLTTFEAIARRLPMAIDIITEPMPQEAGTIKILLEASKKTRLAQVIRQPEDILKIIENSDSRLDNPIVKLPTFQNLDSTDAVYDIASILISQVSANQKTITHTGATIAAK